MLERLWSIFNPSALLVAAIVSGVLVLWTRRWVAGRLLITTAVVAILLLAGLQVDKRLAIALENRFPVPQLPASVAGIIVLGGSIQRDNTVSRGITVLNQNGDRLLHFAGLAHRYPDARLVFSGGGQSGGAKDEASLSASALALMGVDIARIEFEHRSANTFENAVFTRELVRPQPGEVWVLVTSASHMPRAVGAFRAAGWDVLAYPVGFTTGGKVHGLAGPPFGAFVRLYRLTETLRELLALAIYYQRGWTDAFLPG